MLICDGQEAVKEHEGHFSQSGNLTVVSSASGLLDIMVSNITKSNAVKILAEKLNVDLSEDSEEFLEEYKLREIIRKLSEEILVVNKNNILIKKLIQLDKIESKKEDVNFIC